MIIRFSTLFRIKQFRLLHKCHCRKLSSKIKEIKALLKSFNAISSATEGMTVVMIFLILVSVYTKSVTTSFNLV